MTDRRRSNETQGSKNKTAIPPPVAPSGPPNQSPAGSNRPVPIPDPNKSLAEQEPAVLLAMCVFGEARGESEAAQRAVAQVVMNRSRHAHPVFGTRPTATLADNLRRVILQPGQFSSLHPTDPNYPKLLRPLDHEDAAVWERCLRCAAQALGAKEREDALTANSDHYFDDSIQPPSWADPAKRTVKLGRLNFYRLYLPPPRGQSEPPEATARPGTGSAAPPPPQEPPTAEPAAAPKPSPATGLISGSPSVTKPRVSLRRGESGGGSRHPMSLPPRIPQSAWHTRLLQNRREQRAGRLSSLTASGLGIRGSEMGSGEWGVGRGRAESRTPSRESRWRLALLTFCVLLTGCSELERTAYRTLAVTQAEYETIQRHVAEAAVHGLITEEQWNRFQVEGHRFIDAHNAAVDAFQLWSRTKSQANAARLQAVLEILPRLVRDLNSLVESFEKESGVRSQESEEKPPASDSSSWPLAQARKQESGVSIKNQNRNCHPERSEGPAFLLTSDS